MELFAKKVKERAAELGLSHAEVARRSGISERRFGHYMAGRSEPDLKLLVEIAKVLGVTPNDLLGIASRSPLKKHDEAARIRERIGIACQTIDERSLPLALTLVEALLKHQDQR